jgi:hypothetical protein
VEQFKRRAWKRIAVGKSGDILLTIQKKNIQMLPDFLATIN